MTTYKLVQQVLVENRLSGCRESQWVVLHKDLTWQKAKELRKENYNSHIVPERIKYNKN